ncbi:pollen-specific leucine-rich repeat extensin-like protein 4 [Iris pallida]|uniref:Pollen-specific leucine-rich repeat extensin-like protein 4 n=1 Tax=Iris pallida TaxID=29817 RepID=A0AAX6HPV0_IRIPA|nr:pollen-specific leucine-rich repeat extensin-like protein 4 [Iris pallida]KAJ6842574.1 pollen-specific leucine-rich repeat extensin-like protein 4 [Iris pallida]
MFFTIILSLTRSANSDHPRLLQFNTTTDHPKPPQHSNTTTGHPKPPPHSNTTTGHPKPPPHSNTTTATQRPRPTHLRCAARSWDPVVDSDPPPRRAETPEPFSTSRGGATTSIHRRTHPARRAARARLESSVRSGEPSPGTQLLLAEPRPATAASFLRRSMVGGQIYGRPSLRDARSTSTSLDVASTPIEAAFLGTAPPRMARCPSSGLPPSIRLAVALSSRIRLAELRSTAERSHPTATSVETLRQT